MTSEVLAVNAQLGNMTEPIQQACESWPRQLSIVEEQYVEACVLAIESGHGMVTNDDDCEMCRNLKTLHSKITRGRRTVMGDEMRRRSCPRPLLD